jgi:hypothetical protein
MAKWVSGLVLIGLSAACEERGVAGSQNPFAGSAGTGANASVGTSSGTAGGGGAAERYSVCACVATSLDPTAPKRIKCQTCLGDSIKQGAGCKDANDECNQDPECTAIVNCVKACDWADDGASPDCFAACALPRDRNMATMRYHDSVDCSCQQCESDCDIFSKPTCNNQ